jgi:alginate O-acetyltransferase complex protein AlgI
MLFSSPVFFAFFAIYFGMHLLIPVRWRLYLIIGASTFFYAWWKLEYFWIPYLLMATAYFGVIWIMDAKLEPSRKRRAAIVIALLFVPLVFFKYTNFIYNDVLGALTGGGKVLDLTLPLGVSFVTFTLTAYIVDIYRGKFPPQTRPQTVLAYVLLFPHLIAGPILRPNELIPQLNHPSRRKSLLPVAALAVFTVGLVKKLVFADTIADLVDSVYAHAGTASAPEALLAMYGFSVQIYCDFSGYTDMAIGLAMLLGVRLPNNFAQPYCAESIVDFWRRWHKTLSFWLRDYLYVPLGGNREGKVYEIRNIMVTMALGGLWHGASWTFVIWGILQGMAVSSVHAARKLLRWTWLDRVPRWVGVLVTFQFVTVAWVFFRASELRQATDVLRAAVVGNWAGSPQFLNAHVFETLLMALFFVLHRYDDHRRIRIAAARLRPEILWPLLLAGWALAITVSQGSSAKFIYFDF